MIDQILALVNGHPIIALILLTLVPGLELRASIPYGIIKGDFHWTIVFLICVTANIVLGPIVYLLLDKFVYLLEKIPLFHRIYNKFVERTQKKVQKPVEKYGELGIAIFIGVPLPGSGSYTGAFGAYLLGLGYRKFIIANIIGVLIAATIVTAIVLTGDGVFGFLLKTV